MRRTRHFVGSLRYFAALIVLVALFLSCFVTPWVRHERRRRDLAIIRADMNRSLIDLFKTPCLSKPSTRWCMELIKAAYNNVTFNVDLCPIEREISLEEMNRLLVDLKSRTRPVSSAKERDELLKWLWDRLAESGHCGREQVRRHRPVFERCLQGDGKEEQGHGKGTATERGYKSMGSDLVHGVRLGFKFICPNVGIDASCMSFARPSYEKPLAPGLGEGRYRHAPGWRDQSHRNSTRSHHSCPPTHPPRRTSWQ